MKWIYPRFAMRSSGAKCAIHALYRIPAAIASHAIGGRKCRTRDIVAFLIFAGLYRLAWWIATLMMTCSKISSLTTLRNSCARYGISVSENFFYGW